MYIRLVLCITLALKAASLPIPNTEDYFRKPDILQEPDVIPGLVYESYYPNDEYNEIELEGDRLYNYKHGKEHDRTPFIEGDVPSSKRGWDNIPLTWRRLASKRALEAVNRLWKSPSIRRQYLAFIKNGKRSKEFVEHIPVQSENNVDPTWMIDEIGYYADDDSDSLGDSVEDYELTGKEKRGWEIINRPFPSGKRRILKGMGKRAWEPILIKRIKDERSRSKFFDMLGINRAAQSADSNDLNTSLSNLEFLRNLGNSASRSKRSSTDTDTDRSMQS